jgi:NADH dehydrogenase FAD-containing subunit
MKTNDLEQEEELKSIAEEVSNVYVIGDVALEANNPNNVFPSSPFGFSRR